MKLEGARTFEPMPGRPMRGYVTVPPAMVTETVALTTWIGRSLTYAKSLPAKAARGGRAKTGPKTRR